jgi:hypothetical protein
MKEFPSELNGRCPMAQGDGPDSKETKHKIWPLKGHVMDVL